jgi:hypothetical protein
MSIPDSSRAHLIFAFRRVLRPLVKILLRAGVRLDEFIEVVKGVYVECAIRDDVIQIKPLTRARVGLATGVPRRDVDKFVDHPELLASPGPTNIAILAAIINRWHTDAAYLGPYGVPLELGIERNRARSFTELVEQIDKNADPQALLEELLLAQVVAKSGDKHVKVLTRTYVMPEPLSPKVLEYFGSALTNLAGTLEHNMDPKNAVKRLERSVFPDGGLPASFLEEYAAYVRARAQELIANVEDWLSTQAERYEQSREKRIETGLHFFQYVIREPDERTLQEIVDQ